MEQSVVVAYRLSAVHNHSYFFEDAPAETFCDSCGCCIDDGYLPTGLKPANRCDIGYTYDGRCVVSLRFKTYIEKLGFDIAFLPVNADGSLFLMKPEKTVKFSAWKMQNYCNKCHQHADQVIPAPDFYKETGKILDRGIFSTSMSFGSGRAKHQIIVLGVETAKILIEAVKSMKFRGADISKISIKVS